MLPSDKQDKWLKAAVIGSLWGAAEIVLGSFLHNLRIPFSGNILTSIGIILMISGHRLWPQRGIIFRAGLICAALKTMSPSPVILGPMLSIFMQASLMEIAVTLTRGSRAGYLLGGGLAVSWNLLYRILSSIVLYGSSLIALYQNLVDFLVEQTRWTMQAYWGPILILWAIFFSWGVVAAGLGIMVSQAAKKQEKAWEIDPARRSFSWQTASAARTRWSLVRPIIILFLLTGGLYSISILPPLHSLGVLVIFLGIVWFYDAPLLLRFGRKRGFWLAITIMTLLSAFLLGPGYGFSREGLLTGLQMVMRAIYVIGGFGILSSELQRPQVTALFGSQRLAPFHMAVKTAFHTTPLMIEVIPGKGAWRQPIKVLSSMVSSMEYALSYMKAQHATMAERPVFIVTGTKGSGKTTLAGQMIPLFRGKGIKVAGILAPDIVERGQRVGYRVKDVSSGQEELLCKQGGAGRQKENRPCCDSSPEAAPAKQAGQYVFHPAGIRFGEDALGPGKLKGKDLLVLDELGPYELKGLGWDNALKRLLTRWDGSLLLIVRESLVDTMSRHYGLKPTMVFRAGQHKAEEVVSQIKTLLEQGTPGTSATT